MFDTPGPRVFALPPGADFPGAVARGLRERLGQPAPEDMARVEVFLNTGRMVRAVRSAFVESGASFLPRLRQVTDLGTDAHGILPAASPLRRRLELSTMIAALLDLQPDLAPRSALFELADSLAGLLSEMQDEDVTPEAIARIDVSGHSLHWSRTQAFLRVLEPFFGDGELPTAERRQRIAVARLAARWAADPPAHPVIVAGSTGSRGTTFLLMQAVAALPQGALILPGFDFELPAEVWAGLADALTAEDHPQYRHRRLLEALGIAASAVKPWMADRGDRRALNRLVSLSLRPAPVTDQWLVEGPALPDLVEATGSLTLIEAAGPREEATAIALVLRKAAEDGVAAALISPDRLLTRQVAAALDRWGILPDDSAGRPLGLSAPGRFLRHVAALFGRRLTSEALVTLLKHPLAASGPGRGPHLRWTRELELKLRRHGPVFPTGQALLDWAGGESDPSAWLWAAWLANALRQTGDHGPGLLAEHVARHVRLSEELARGPEGTGAGLLWQDGAGEAAFAAMAELAREAAFGGAVTPSEYEALLGGHLSTGEIRDAVQSHPLIQILGPREARECRAQLVVLGGLNDGSWPRLPAPDPWLNRRMRLDSGLLLPERQIGLSAHDYQQAIAAPAVVLTRAHRDAAAETVPSRWLNRLVNLMGGLRGRNGPEAVAAMRDRGNLWLGLAARVDRPDAPVRPAPRPAPRPPVAHRPKKLSVTRIRSLIRDPYDVYARNILCLVPLDPLRQTPDPLARGTAFHTVLERFVRGQTSAEGIEAARLRLIAIAEEVLAEEVPWPAARALWRARIERVARAFVTREASEGGRPLLIEDSGTLALPAFGFVLVAKPDRIDEMPDGRLHVLDYKSGAPPTPKQQKHFDKQLLLEAVMAERGGFAALGPREVARITYVGLNSAAKVETTEVTPDLTTTVWEDLNRLIGHYMDRGRGYVSRRAITSTRLSGDYDHLARFGEWDMTDRPEPEDVG